MTIKLWSDVMVAKGLLFKGLLGEKSLETIAFVIGCLLDLLFAEGMPIVCSGVSRIRVKVDGSVRSDASVQIAVHPLLM